MSSSDTAYSPDNSPNRKDWAQLNKHENGGYGIGPGVRDPNDPIQNSDTKYEQHQEKVAQTVGAGPSTKMTSDMPQYGHFEHLEYARSPALSPPPPTQAQPLTHQHLNEHLHQLHLAPTASTNNTFLSHRTKKEIDHDNTLSSIRTKIGLERESPIIDDHHVHQHLNWSSVRTVLREPFAEFFGVFVMVLFGDGSVAQVLLSAGQKSAPGMNGFGSYQSINWCWGLGVMLGIYVAGDSGAFLNPAITFSFCLFRKLPWRRFPIYFLAQFLGGFCAAGVVYANYVNAINEYEGHGIRTVPPSSTATAGIFCTYPQAFLTKASMFFSEFIASTILIFVIFALKDDSNPGAMGKSGAGPFFPLALLFLIFGLGAGFGWETGYAINLARDLGPRLMSYILGYGSAVWSAGGYYFWIPMVAPFCGCAFGAFLYDFFVYTGPETPVNTPWLGLKDVWFMLSKPSTFWRGKKEKRKGEYEV